MGRGVREGGWDLVTVLDGNGVVLRQSPGVEAVLGYTLEEMLGEEVLDFIHPADSATGEEILRRVSEEPGVSPPFELRWLHRDGSWRWLETICDTAAAGSGGGELVWSSRDVTGRVERAAALSESERRFRAIVESSLEVVKIVSASGRLLYANPAFEEVYGYDPGEAVASGMNVLEYVHPDDLPQVLEDTERTLKALNAAGTGGACPPLGHTTEYRFRCADGTYRWIEGVGSYLLDEPGVEGVIIHARDITERRRAEEELRESEELRRAAIWGAPVILFALDEEGVFTLSEGQGLEALGLGESDVVGRSVFDFHHDYPEILENNRRALAGEEFTDTVEYGGVYFETRYSPLYGRSGRQAGTVCVATDVTERRRAETESQLKDRALEASSNGVIITNPNLGDNPIIYVNPAFQKICGYEFDEIIGNNCRMFQREDREQPELGPLSEAIAAGREHSCTLRNYRKDGTLFYNELYIAPVRDVGGHLTHFVGIQNDVTERRALEEELSYRAFHDPLTGLPNRSLFVDRLEHALTRAYRRGEATSVLFMDLDDFKEVNDGGGHEAGDELLVTVASRLHRCLRPEDTVCRLGGDEFVILLEDTDEAEAERLAQRILGVSGSPVELSGPEGTRRVRVTTSLGVAVFSSGHDGGRTPQDLLREADAAMYRAKRRGKAGYEMSVISPGGSGTGG